MNEKNFCIKAKDLVATYVNSHLDKPDNDNNFIQSITVDDVYIVWMCKILRNNKALISTTLPDGMYYEITYNGDRMEFYLDVYKKSDSVCMYF